MNRIHFDTLALAVEYAKQHGGWIWNDGKDVQWFNNANGWNPTKIIKAVKGGGVLAPWDTVLSMSIENGVAVA